MENLFQISGATLARCYLIHGEDRFMRSRALSAIQSAVSPTPEGLLCERFSGKNLSIATLLNTLNTRPFFNPIQLVIVDGWLTTKLFKDATWPLMLAYLQNPAPFSVLVIIEDKLPAAKKDMDLIIKSAKVLDCAPLKDAQIRTMITALFKQHGKTVRPEVVEWIHICNGTNLAEIESSIRRIVTYCGNDTAPITLETVEKLVTDTSIRSIFELSDAFFSKNPETIPIYRRLMADSKSSPIPLLALLYRKAEQMDYAKKHSKDPQSKILATLKIPPFAGTKFFNQLRAWTPTKLHDLKRDFMETDHALKRDPIDDTLLVETTLLKYLR